MKKIYKSCLLMAFALVTNSAFSQITFDFSRARTSGSSVVQTISNNGFNYVLTATHNSGDVDLWGDDSGEFTSSGNSLFFSPNATSTPEIWTVSLTRDGVPYAFDLENVSYERFCGSSPTFDLVNDENITMATANSIALGAGSFIITGNNTGISNFTITSNTGGATLCTDFGNIKLTPVDVVLSTNENEVTVRTVSNVSPNPTTGIVKLSFDNDVEKQIELFDANGQLLTSQTSINKEEIINLNDYNSGLYYVRVTNKQANQTIRVVKL